MTITEETTVGSVATEHPLATRVFARHGIDYCCGGGRSLSDACTAGGVATDTVLAELDAELTTTNEDITRWDQAPARELIDHILKTFHEPLREELPRLLAMAEKVFQVHGDKDPKRLRGIVETLVALKLEMFAHMQKEEQILFPMIAAGQGAMAGGPVSVMEAEHEHAGNLLRQLNEYTDSYVAPDGACNTWRALWAGLEDLEKSTHVHIHLENNILFPQALAS